MSQCSVCRSMSPISGGVYWSRGVQCILVVVAFSTFCAESSTTVPFFPLFFLWSCTSKQYLHPSTMTAQFNLRTCISKTVEVSFDIYIMPIWALHAPFETRGRKWNSKVKWGAAWNDVTHTITFFNFLCPWLSNEESVRCDYKYSSCWFVISVSLK